jgi:hypothetical protein
MALVAMRAQSGGGKMNWWLGALEAGDKVSPRAILVT